MARGKPRDPRCDGPCESGRHRSTTFNVFDWFVVINLSLFLAAAGSVFLRRFVRFRGEEHLGEFGVYAVISVVAVLAVWRGFRRYDWPVWLLLAAEAAILVHFAGGLVPYREARLYDLVLYGVRFDKFVHGVNSFIAALVISHVTRRRGLTVVLMVLGLGAFWEIVEYAVVSRVPDTGVGLYDNNLQDLVANLTGSLTWLGLSGLQDALHRSVSGSSTGRNADGA